MGRTVDITGSRELGRRHRRSGVCPRRMLPANPAGVMLLVEDDEGVFDWGG